MERAMGSICSSLDDRNYFEKDWRSEATTFHDGQVSASEDACKDALLSSENGVDGSSSRQRQWQMILGHMSDWSLRNLTVAALTCVVFGGLVAIMVSFGG
jgi:hypothetical protein